MANTTELRKVDKYIFTEYQERFGELLTRRKIQIGNTGIMKEFSSVSKDKLIIVQTSHSSGKTEGGKSPSAKIEAVLSKCLLMEKTTAVEKYYIFTNKDFADIYIRKCKNLTPSIIFEVYEKLPQELLSIIIDIQIKAKKEVVANL